MSDDYEKRKFYDFLEFFDILIATANSMWELTSLHHHYNNAEDHARIVQAELIYDSKFQDKEGFLKYFNEKFEENEREYYTKKVLSKDHVKFEYDWKKEHDLHFIDKFILWPEEMRVDYTLEEFREQYKDIYTKY